MPWKRAAKAAGNEEKRQSLWLCLAGKSPGQTKRLDRAGPLSFAMRQRWGAKSTLKRQQFTTRRPIRPEILQRWPLPPTVVKGRLGRGGIRLRRMK